MDVSPAHASSPAQRQRVDARLDPFASRPGVSFGDALDVQLAPQGHTVSGRTASGRARASGAASGVPPLSNGNVVLVERDLSFRARTGDQEPGLGAADRPSHSDRTSAGGSGFEPSRSPQAPHLIRYQSVPDSFKFPNGPYRQAPQEHGGEWWFVNPFTGPEPWLRPSQIEEALRAVETLPEGFAEVFGPRPTRKQIPDYFEFRLAKHEWEQDLHSFKRTGVPEGSNEADLASAALAFDEWGLGQPVYYEGAAGWRVRFPGSAAPGFEMNANTALQAPHLVIAKYQIRLLEQGVTPENPHPWIPPHLLTRASESA